MSDRPTYAVWITRGTTTVKHIRGLLEGLEKAESLEYAQLRILTVDDEQGVRFGDGILITQDNLPPEGLLIFDQDETPTLE